MIQYQEFFAQRFNSIPNDHIMFKVIGGDQLTKKIFKDQVDQRVAWLSEKMPDAQNICIAIENSLEFCRWYYGAMLLGKTLIPVPLEFTDEQIASFGDHCHGVLFETSNKTRFNSIFEHFTGECDFSSVSALHMEGKHSHNDLIKVIHTSGTTSNPKGAMITGTALKNQVSKFAKFLDFLGPIHYFSFQPLSLLNEQMLALLLPLYTKGCTVFKPDHVGCLGSSSENSELYLETLPQEKPNFVYLPTQLLGMLWQNQEKYQHCTKHLANTYTTCGGTFVPEFMINAFKDLGITLYQGYGMSENTAVFSLCKPGDNAPGSVGRPMDGNTAKIVDGEIWVTSDTLFIGYWGEGKPTLDGYLPTGDTGFLNEEGYLFVTGKKKNQLTLANARNVSPEHLESLLSEHLDTDQIVVYGDGDDSLGVLVKGEADSAKLQKAISAISSKVPSFCHIKRYMSVTPGESKEHNLWTMTGRPKRQVINEYIAKNLRSEFQLGEKLQ